MGGLEGDDHEEGDDGGEGEDWGLSVSEFEGGGAGEMGDVYEEALRTLLRLQGEGGLTGQEGGREEEEDDESSGTRGGGVKGLATTVGKVERAGRAAEVVEKM